tara:strand:- start:406 stop:522 length:117 start_codon:yes stop_codon:yes gene_type:complete
MSDKPVIEKILETVDYYSIIRLSRGSREGLFVNTSYFS